MKDEGCWELGLWDPEAVPKIFRKFGEQRPLFTGSDMKVASLFTMQANLSSGETFHHPFWTQK
jgi:hypothetical protein